MMALRRLALRVETVLSIESHCGSLEKNIGVQVRGIKHSRFKVIENKAHHVRRRNAIKFREEIAFEGSEPRWKDIQEKIKKSPGRKTLGRGEFGLGRRAAKRGFEELEQLYVKDSEDLSDRIQAHHRAQLKGGIPRPLPEDGHTKGVRVLRAERILLELLQDKLYHREFLSLDETCQAVTQSQHAIVHITRIELSDDFANCSVYWLLPPVQTVLSEAAFVLIKGRMDRLKPTFRWIFNKRIKRRRAPLVEVVYDKKAANSEIALALMNTHQAVGAENPDDEFSKMLNRQMTEEEQEKLFAEAMSNKGPLSKLLRGKRGDF